MATTCPPLPSTVVTFTALARGCAAWCAHVAEPEKVIAAGPVPFVANEVNAVGIYPAVVAVTGPKTALLAAIAATGGRGTPSFFTKMFSAAFFLRKTPAASLLVMERRDAFWLVRKDPAK